MDHDESNIGIINQPLSQTFRVLLSQLSGTYSQSFTKSGSPPCQTCTKTESNS